MIITTMFSLILSACIHFQAVATDISTPEPHINYEIEAPMKSNHETPIAYSHCALCDDELGDVGTVTIDGVVCDDCTDFYECVRCGEPQPIHATDGYTCERCSSGGEHCPIDGSWIPDGYYCCVCD